MTADAEVAVPESGPEPERGRVAVPLPNGTVEVTTLRTGPRDAWAHVVVAHGAGAGPEHPFLAGFASALAAAGVCATRFAFPYREAGRRLPGPAAHAVATWEAVAAEENRPWTAIGKSYGGRMASVAAAEGRIAPLGLAYLGYPLHPPGRPEKERAAHLPEIVAPQLFVSGTRDAFVDPHERLEAIVAGCRAARIEWVDGGGHSFEVAGRARAAEETGAAVAALVLPFLADAPSA